MSTNFSEKNRQLLRNFLNNCLSGGSTAAALSQYSE